MTSRVRHTLTRTLTRNIEFIDAVTHGDEDAARWALEAGADVNATDSAGRSSVACAITGESWKTVDASDASFMTASRLNVLRLLVEHQHISLYSLNAPQDAMNGVTPLSMASWLNAPDVVCILLDSSLGSVAVNGMDAHGATALMYASRDGNFDVIKSIVRAGGRPDFRDRHHRTSVQYSLDHPQVLWVCEEALRRHRIQECQSGNARQLSLVAQVDIDLKHEAASHEIQNYPPAHLFSPTDVLTNTNALVKCIITADIPVLQSLLFPPPLLSSDASPASLATPAPVLVNKPDAEDWSPIHYCTSVRRPSIEVLDILYRAGADVSLFSRTGNCTPLHCLARRKRGPDALRGSESLKMYQFVVHLVRDLDAPLAALDLNKDTCIHVAAEHGDSAEVLRALLDCDKDGSVRETKNSRGLTALEIAKPEFRIVFGVLDEHLRPESSASLLTVRPLHSYSSVPSLASVASDVASIRLCPSPVSPISPILSVSSPVEDPTSASQRLIRNLRFISHELEETPEPAVSDLDRLQTILKQTAVQSTHLLSQLRSRITDVRDELSGAHDNWAKTDSMLDAVAQAVDEKLKKYRVIAGKRPSGEFYGRQRSDTTVSADSQTTAVGSESDEPASAKLVAPDPRSASASASLNASTSQVLDLAEPKNGEIHDDLLASWPPWLDPFEAKVPSLLEPQFGQETGSLRGHSRLKASKSMIDLRRTSISPVKAPSPPSSDSPRTRPRADTIAGGMKAPSETAKDGETSSAARLKAWFKRKLKPERPERPAKPVPELPSARSSTEPRSSLTTLCEQDEHAAESPCKKEVDQESGPEKVLQFSYRPLAAAGKDMARIDESMTTAGKYVASAYRSLIQAERIIKKALKTREALIQEHRSAHSVDAGLAAVLAWEPSSVPSIDIAAAAPFPSRARSDSSASAHSSVASALTSSSSEGEEDDVKQLYRLLTRKTEGRIDEASYQVERVNVWLRVVQDVLRGVETCAGLQL